MNGKVHMALGAYIGVTGGILLSAGATDIPISNSLQCAVFTMGTVIGSLFLDIDTPTSIIGRKVYLLSKIINMSAGHRGILHSLFGITIMVALLYIQNLINIPLFFIYGFTIGCLIHLLQDMMTTRGVPLFYPLSKKKIGPRLFNSKSKWSVITTMIFGIIWTCFIFIVVSLNVL